MEKEINKMIDQENVANDTIAASFEAEAPGEVTAAAENAGVTDTGKSAETDVLRAEVTAAETEVEEP